MFIHLNLSICIIAHEHKLVYNIQICFTHTDIEIFFFLFQYVGIERISQLVYVEIFQISYLAVHILEYPPLLTY